MKRTFIYTDAKSDKFWSIEITGNTFTVNYGKTGTDGQTQTKDFPDEAACQKAADKLIAEKTKKGYVEEGSTAPATVATPTPTVTSPVPEPVATAQPAEEPVEETIEEPVEEPKNLNISVFVEKELVKHYNKCITAPLTDEQMIALDKYLYTGDDEAAAILPLIEKTPHENNPVYRVKYDDEYKKEGNTLAQYVGLLYTKGGQDEAFYLLSQRNYKSGLNINGFGLVQQIEALLHKLYDQIHYEDIQKYKKQLDNLFQSNPAEFEEVVANCYPLSRLRAAAFLYLKNVEKYGPVLDALIDKYEETVNRDGVELLFNSCGLCEFKHEQLNQKLAEYFRIIPGTVVSLLEFDQDFYPNFLDEKFKKNYDTRHSTAAQFNYTRNMAKHIGIEDLHLLRGIYRDGERYDMKDVVLFFKDYPIELIIEVYQYEMERAERADYVSKLFVHFYRILGNANKTPLYDAVTPKFDTYLESYMNFRYDIGDEDSSYAAYHDDLVAYFMNNDRVRLGRFGSKEHYENGQVFRSNGYYEIFEFLGLVADYPPAASVVRPIIQMAAVSGQARHISYFVRGAMTAWQWDAEKINDFIDEGYNSGFADPWGMVTFYDEILISDVEHKADNIHNTQEISDMFIPGARAFLTKHQDVAFDYAYTTSLGYNIGFLHALYTDNPDANPELLVNLLKEKNKLLRTKAVRYLPAYPAARPAVEELLNSKRKDIREWAEKALAAFENLNATSLGGNAPTTTVADANFDIAAYVKKNTPKNWEKVFIPSWKSNLPITNPQTWPVVRKAGTTEPAELDYVICYITTYALSKDMQKMLYPEKMRSYFEEADLKVLALHLFDEWMEAGAESKSKGIMTLVGIHGGVEGIQRLKDAVAKFVFNSRSAMAGDAVKAMAVSNSNLALVAVDNMGRTHRNKLVKRIAAETMEAAAQSLGITVEQLADKIVPNLGLDERGEMVLETGSRKLFVRLKADLSIELKTEEGKVLKSFPGLAAGDGEVYHDSKADFTTLKKELKSLVTMQNLRLQQSLAKGRIWNKEGFEELFIQNPIMQIFASSLIFGVYQDGKPAVTFRYAGDGSYTDINDDTFTLSDDAEIRLVHPIELSEEDKKRWKEQLDDYEMLQPFPQLLRPTFSNADIATKTYDGFVGTWVTGYFGTRMYKGGWERDPSGDAGSYYCLYYIGSEYSVCLDFADGSICIAYPDNENVGLGALYFCKTANARVSYRMNVHDNDIIPVADIPAPFFSEVIYMLQQGVEACKVKDDE